MLIGAMNDPSRDLLEQIRWMGENGLEFLDLTLEPPGAPSWSVDGPAVLAALKKYKLRVVGLTAPYLPLASPIEKLRQAAILELRRCVGFFRAVGAPWMNVHPSLAPARSRQFAVGRMIESLQEILCSAREQEIGVMIENAPGQFNTALELAELLDPLPELGLHLDVGHTNLMTPVNTVKEVLAAHAPRVRHVHCHDNKGGNLDLHLPLGVGNIDLRETVRALKASHYDGTITLEVFSPDKSYLLHSRDILRRLWDTA
jgi:sugar phosphate isomerase/epimerase